MRLPFVQAAPQAQVRCSWANAALIAFGLWMALCGGTQYAFSAFEVKLMHQCNLSAKEVDGVYAAGQLGVGCGIIPSLMYMRYGAGVSAVYGAVVVLAAAQLLAHALQQDGCGTVWYIGALHFLLQNGSAAIYQTGLLANVAHAPTPIRGMVVGTIASGYGLSAALWSTLFNSALHGDLRAYYQTISWLFSATSCLAAILLPWLSRRLAVSSQEVEQERASLLKTRDRRLSTVLSSMDFWIFVAIFVLSETLGASVFIANMALMGRSFGVAEALRASNLKTFAFVNCGARVVVGALVDCCSARGLPLAAHTVWSSLLLTCGVAALRFAPASLANALYTPILHVVAFGYGANFALLPAYSAFCFGKEHLWATFNISIFIMAVLCIGFSPLVGALYDAAAARQKRVGKAAGTAACLGPDCWADVLSIALAVGCVILGLSVWLTQRAYRARRAPGQSAATSA